MTIEDDIAAVRRFDVDPLLLHGAANRLAGEVERLQDQNKRLYADLAASELREDRNEGDLSRKNTECEMLKAEIARLNANGGAH